MRIGVALTVLAAALVLATRAAAVSPVVRCGDVSDFVAPTASADGSFVLRGDGTELRIAAPARLLTSVPSGYTCASIVPGTPNAQLTGILSPGTPGYVTPSAPVAASRFQEAATSLVLLTTALVFFAILVVFGSYGGAWGRRLAAPSVARPYNDDIRRRPGGVRTSHR